MVGRRIPDLDVTVSRGTAVTFPVSLADRAWAPAVTAAMVGPVAMPGRAAVVDAVARLAAQLPYGRLGWTMEGAAQRWRFAPRELPGLAESMVVEVAEDPAEDYATFATAVATRTDLAWPIALVVAPRHLAVRVSHASGDGRLIAALISGVLQSASGGALPQWPGRPDLAHPFARAVAGFVRAQPSRTLAAARAVRPPRGNGKNRPTVPWVPQRETVYAVMAPSRFEQLRQWRKVHAAGSSNPALELAVLLRALSSVGLTVRPQVLVLFDLRRYLPVGSQLWGNFVVGVQLPLTAAMPVARVSAALAQTNEAGRPLTAFAANLALRRSPRPPPTAVGTPASIQLAFTHLGRPREIERLPWLHGAPRTYNGSVEPAGPEGFTVAVTETGRCLHLSSSFHGNVLDRGLVSRALERLCADPVDLLHGSRSPRVGV